MNKYQLLTGMYMEACDLASSPSRASLIEEIQTLPEGKTLLINNAGLGDYGEYTSSTPERNHQMLQVNVLAVAELTRAASHHHAQQPERGVP